MQLHTRAAAQARPRAPVEHELGAGLEAEREVSTAFPRPLGLALRLAWRERTCSVSRGRASPAGPRSRPPSPRCAERRERTHEGGATPSPALGPICAMRSSPRLGRARCLGGPGQQSAVQVATRCADFYDHDPGMALFSSTDPGLRPLIAYIVARSRERGITLNRTKLVKLLYLIDVERVRSGRRPLTGLEWKFFHYGPYAFELIDTLEAMEGSELVSQEWHDSVLYRAAPGAPEGDDWYPATKSMVDNIIRRFAPLDLNELLDHVYFYTGPMVHAQRGQPLDLGRAREDPRYRQHIPLRAPARPPDIEHRLERWRQRTTRRFAPVVLEPPGQFLDDPDEDLGGEGVPGRLHVPEGSEL